MKNIIEKLVSFIKEKTPPGINPVYTLTKIIPMSNEAAYRRLRGEVDFSFEEVVKIAKAFNLSLDYLAGINQENNRDNVQIICPGLGSSLDGYCQSVEKLINSIKELKTHSNSTFSLASSIHFPFSYTYKNPILLKYRLFSWLYQFENNLSPKKMKDFIVPSEVIELENVLCHEMQDLSINFICSSEIIQTSIDYAKYLQRLGLLTQEEIAIIKTNLLYLLDELEDNAVNGKNKNGYPFNFYICNTQIALTHLSLNSNDYDVISNQLFGVGFFFFKDTVMINQMKEWVNNLIKNSTLISISGEKKRIEFFQKQRDCITKSTEF